eukprot:jgi/Tetstr1/438415/TSEL_002900.t1
MACSASREPWRGGRRQTPRRCARGAAAAPFGRGGFAGSASVAVCPPPLAALAGAVAGSVVTAVLHPLDTLKCAAGACASVATSFIYTPTECVKAQLQVGKYGSPRQAVMGMVQQGGPLALFRGWGAVLARNIPQSVIKFMVYEQLLAAATRPDDSADQRTAKSLVCGAAAAMTGACVTTPIDVVKTRIQAQGASGGAVATLRTILAEERLPGLYRGLLPRLGIYMAQGAVFFTAYGALKHMLAAAAEASRQRRSAVQAELTGVGLQRALLL